MRLLLIIILFIAYFNVSEAKILKVAVIDTGFNTKHKTFPICKSGSVDFTGLGMHDTNGHGNNISHIIDKHAKSGKYCQMPLKYYGVANSLLATMSAMEYAWKNGAAIVNYSSGGEGYDIEEHILIKKMLDANMVIVVAAGNNGQDLDKNCNYYPACYDKRLVVVGNLSSSTKRNITSNFGSIVKAWEIGTNVSAGGYTLTGTSQATAVFTGRLIHQHGLRYPQSIESKTTEAITKIPAIKNKIKEIEKKIKKKLPKSSKYIIPITNMIIDKEIQILITF